LERDSFKVLIVDDEQINLDVLIGILQSAGGRSKDGNRPPYRISVAKSGPAALARVAADRPDLILLDMVLPGMSGFEILSTLKGSEATRDIPVIVISSLDAIEDVEAFFGLGAADFIAKPFHQCIVEARVDTHLRLVEQTRLIERLGTAIARGPE